MDIQRLSRNDPRAMQALGHRFGTTLCGEELLVFQYTKLLNYFNDLIPVAWGGWLPWTAPQEKIQAAKDNFLAACRPLVGELSQPWIHRKRINEPWSENNLEIKEVPSNELGPPFEVFVSLKGKMVSAHQACRILRIEPSRLVLLKLSLLFDEAVVAEALENLLIPRSYRQRIVRKNWHGRIQRKLK